MLKMIKRWFKLEAATGTLEKERIFFNALMATDHIAQVAGARALVLQPSIHAGEGLLEFPLGPFTQSG